MSSQSLGQGKIGHSSYKSKMLIYIISQQNQFFSPIRGLSTLQIPIECRRSILATA
jgi:hypothetical protein